MKDQLVSLETAVLAKELGFDEYTDCIFINSNYPMRVVSSHNDKNSSNNEEYCSDGYHVYDFVCSDPTQALLQKWIREIHGECVYCVPVVNTSFEVIYYYYEIIADLVAYDISHEKERYKTYEEALEAGLQTSLKFLKTKKNERRTNNF